MLYIIMNKKIRRNIQTTLHGEKWTSEFSSLSAYLRKQSWSIGIRFREFYLGGVVAICELLYPKNGCRFGLEFKKLLTI